MQLDRVLPALFCLFLSATDAAWAGDAQTAFVVERIAEYDSYFTAAAKEVEVSSDLAKAIAQVESGRHPWTLNIAGKSYFYDTKQEALIAAERASAAGKSFDTGIMQVNNWWLRKYGIPLDAALDPAANILLGSWILRKALDEHPRDQWAGVGKYHSPNAARGERYAEQVRRALERGPVGAPVSGKARAKKALQDAKNSEMRPEARSAASMSRRTRNLDTDTDAAMIVFAKPVPVFHRQPPTGEAGSASSEGQEATDLMEGATGTGASKGKNGDVEAHVDWEVAGDEVARESVNDAVRSRVNDEELVPAVLVREPPERYVFDEEGRTPAAAGGRAEFVRRMR